MRKAFIKIKNIVNEDKYYGEVINFNYFSDTLIIARGVMKQLASGKKNIWDLTHGFSEVDSRVFHEIPYSSYLKYVIQDLILRGLITKLDEEYFELTSKGFEIYSNYTLDSLAVTAHSNRLAYRLNKKAIIISVVALIVSVIAIFKTS